MSLDSLLDTITNVVGFLVIVLAVVQLSAAHAVRKMAPIRMTDAPSPVKIKGLNKEIQELYARLNGLLSQIERKEDDKVIATALVNKDWDKKKKLDAQIASLLTKIADINREIMKARTDLANLDKEIKRLEGLPPPPPPPKQAKEELPDIRVQQRYKDGSGAKPAWMGKKRVQFICRGGRVFRYNSDRLEAQMVRGIRNCLGIRGSGKINIDGISQLEKIKKYFDVRKIQDEYFRIKLDYFRSGTSVVLFATYQFRSDVQGETTASLKSGKGKFEQLMKAYSPRKTWIRFYVWGDSFETYREARAIVSSRVSKLRKFQVGWLPMGEDERIRIVLIGGRSSDITDGPGT